MWIITGQYVVNKCNKVQLKWKKKKEKPSFKIQKNREERIGTIFVQAAIIQIEDPSFESKTLKQIIKVELVRHCN